MNSIYKEKKPLSFDFVTAKSKSIGSIILLIVLALLALSLIYFGVQGALTKKPIELSFEKNPITLNDENVLLNAKITNITSINAEQVQVTAKPKGNVPLVITVERNGLIGSIAIGEERKIKIIVNPVEGILPGNYLIDVTVKISGQQFTESITLKIKE
jgi:ABC-type Na+ efflux pump permease subunit